MKIWCCECNDTVDARLTNGSEVYPHRPDLGDIPRWICDGCGNHVGCHHRHHDKKKRKDPLGTIAGPEMANARKHIHRILDPLWQNSRSKGKARKEVYARIAREMGLDEYHTAELRTLDEARKAYAIIADIANGRPELPVFYEDYTAKQRAHVRAQYERRQLGCCAYCGEPLDGEPPARILFANICWEAFPKGFRDHPKHLQHDHDTGLTEGVVHNVCNAYMWQFEGR